MQMRVTIQNWQRAINAARAARAAGRRGEAAEHLRFAGACRRAWWEDLCQEWGDPARRWGSPLRWPVVVE